MCSHEGVKLFLMLCNHGFALPWPPLASSPCSASRSDSRNRNDRLSQSPIIPSMSSSSAPAARVCAPRWNARRAGLKTACITKVFPDPQPYRGGAGRRRRRARQYGRGRLALAYVRHGQGLGLAGRPGRHRISLPERAGSRSTSWSISACRSRAPRTARSISAPSAA